MIRRLDYKIRFKVDYYQSIRHSSLTVGHFSVSLLIMNFCIKEIEQLDLYCLEP